MAEGTCPKSQFQKILLLLQATGPHRQYSIIV